MDQSHLDPAAASAVEGWPGICVDLLDGDRPGRTAAIEDVLEPDPDTRYVLSPSAAAGIVIRGSRRGRTLPARFEKALWNNIAADPTVEEDTRVTLAAEAAGDVQPEQQELFDDTVLFDDLDPLPTTPRSRIAGADGDVRTFRKSARAQTNTDAETWVPDTIANTLTTFDVGEVRSTVLVVEDDGTGTNSEVVRRLTPVEAERLLGWPDAHTSTGADGREIADNARFQMAGNAVATPVAAWIAGRLAELGVGPVGYGSVCTGVGGLDMGMETQGHDPVFFCEINRDCRDVLARHWPAVPVYDDLAALKADDLVSDGNDGIGLLVGGTPCTDLSTAGRQEGLAAERSGLFFDFVRLLRDLRPGVFVWENVPGLFRSDDGRDFPLAMDAFADAGYLVDLDVLDAQFFGVAQRRRRVFVVGVRPDVLLASPKAGEVAGRLYAEMVAGVVGSCRAEYIEAGEWPAAWTRAGLVRRVELVTQGGVAGALLDALNGAAPGPWAARLDTIIAAAGGTVSEEDLLGLADGVAALRDAGVASGTVSGVLGLCEAYSAEACGSLFGPIEHAEAWSAMVAAA